MASFFHNSLPHLHIVALPSLGKSLSICLLFSVTSSFNETVWLSDTVALAMMEAISASIQVPLRRITWGHLRDLCPAPTLSPMNSPVSLNRVQNMADLAVPSIKFRTNAGDPRTFFSIQGEPGGQKTGKSLTI